MTDEVEILRRDLLQMSKLQIQALRAWLPSGTKAILPSKRLRIILALMGLKPKAKPSSPFGFGAA
jgi:hypothetical protein